MSMQYSPQRNAANELRSLDSHAHFGQQQQFFSLCAPDQHADSFCYPQACWEILKNYFQALPRRKTIHFLQPRFDTK
jgi:hypothetical protein